MINSHDFEVPRNSSNWKTWICSHPSAASCCPSLMYSCVILTSICLLMRGQLWVENCSMARLGGKEKYEVLLSSNIIIFSFILQLWTYRGRELLYGVARGERWIFSFVNQLSQIFILICPTHLYITNKSTYLIKANYKDRWWVRMPDTRG